MKEFEYNNCFACGKDNKIGLKLDYKYENEQAIAEFTLGKQFEGYENTIHGGIIATLLDESMAKIILHNNIIAVTAKLEIDYKKSLMPDKLYFAYGKIMQAKSKIIKCCAEIKDEDDNIVASAKAIFFKLKNVIDR